MGDLSAAYPGLPPGEAGAWPVIACYHAAGPAVSDNPLLSGTLHRIESARLHRDLEILRRNATILPLAELAARARRGATLDGLAAVTFDDGYRSVLDHALPVLEALEVPATLFVIGAVTEGGLFWRDRVRLLIAEDRVAAFLAWAGAREPRARALRAERFHRDSKDPGRLPPDVLDALLAGFLEPEAARIDALAAATYLRADDLAGWDHPCLSLANHTARHYPLAALSATAQRAEIEAGAAALEALGVAVEPILALPFGNPGSFDDSTLAAAREARVETVLATNARGAWPASASLLHRFIAVTG